MNRISRWFPFAVLAAAIFCYANSFDGPFIFDDNRVILTNPHLYTLWPPWKAVLVPTRAVADISFALNFAISGLTPADYRMTNVLIHVLGGLLLYGIMRRTLRLPRFGDRFRSSADALGFVTALLWVVHPMQTESVTYIAQRIEAVMGLFYLLLFYCFVRGLTSTRPRAWMGGALAACVVGMGTKEVMVTAPFMLLLYDGLLVCTSWREALRKRWRLHLAMFLSLGVFAMLFLLGMARAAGTGSLFVKAITPWRYAITQFGVIVHYLKLSFVPTSLCLSYRWPFARSLAEVWPQAVFIGMLVLATVVGLIRRRAFGFPLAWLFVILAPTSSIMPISDAAFEHRMYLPLAGLLAGVVVGAYTAFEHLATRASRLGRWQAALGFLVLVVAAWFMALTRARNLDYRSEEVVWRDIMIKRPTNFNPYVALSRTLIAEGRLEEAKEVLTNAIARMPDFSKVPYEELRRRFKQDVSLPCVEYAMAHNNLGVVYLDLKHLDEASDHFKEAMRVYPNNHIGYFNMGRIALAQGRTNEAMGWWRVALQKKPHDVDTLCVLAINHDLQGEYASAAMCYRSALRWNRNHPFARSQLAWLLATCPDSRVRNGTQALTLARALPEMSGGMSSRAYDILAAASAEAGHYDEAVSNAQIAVDMAKRRLERRNPPSVRPVPAESATDTFSQSNTGPEETLAALEQRLSLYRQRQPYRESR